MAGLAIILLVVAAALLAGCGSAEGSSGEAASSGSKGDSQVVLPDALGDLQPYESACAALDADAQQRCADGAKAAQDAVQAAADNLSQAYDGATAEGSEYVGDDFNQMVRVLAVAAPSPGLWTVDSDVEAAREGLGHPQEWVEESDGAQCLARTTSPVQEGSELDPEDVVVVRCQQSGDDLTVTLLPGGETSLEDALAWTGQVFTDVSE
jgi:hypothetical protein